MASRGPSSLLSASTGVGCLFWLCVAAIAGFWLNHRLGPTVLAEARPWIAGVAGLAFALGLSNFWQLLTGYGSGEDSRAARLARAAEGRMPSSDAPAVARGVVHAVGVPLRAPISGAACTSYSYTMFREMRQGSKTVRVPIYWGLASRAFALQVKSRVVRVRAVPRLLDRPERRASFEDIERARAYVAAARFEQVGEGLLNTMSSVGEMVSAILGDEDGAFRKDWARVGGPVDPGTLILEESALPVGVEASVSGYWSLKDQAIVTHVDDREPEPVTATRGATETLTGADGTLPRSRLSVVITGLLLVGLAIGLAWGAPVMLPVR
jgi:hypothetical protein